MLFVLMGFLFIRFVHCDVKNPCSFDVNMKQMLLNEGFHRNITYGLVFSGWDERSQWLYQGCTVGLDQSLPPGVFVDEDELKELKRSQRLSASPKNPTNVELLAEHATDSDVYIVGNILDDKAYLWLPVHARYHAAKKGGGTARNTIPPPTLYLKCPDERLLVCDHFSSFQCNGRDEDRCMWKDISYKLVVWIEVIALHYFLCIFLFGVAILLTEPLEWDVPVGNTDRYYLVATGTVSVVVFGSLYLLHAIHQFSLRLDKDEADERDDHSDGKKDGRRNERCCHSKDGDDRNDSPCNEQCCHHKKDGDDNNDAKDDGPCSEHCPHRVKDDDYNSEEDDDHDYSTENDDDDYSSDDDDIPEDGGKNVRFEESLN